MAKIELSSALLADASRYTGSVLMLGCTICGWAKGYEVWRIIRRLHELGAGDATTPIGDVAKSVTHA